MQKTIIKTNKAPAPVGVYNQAVIAPAGKLLYTAGQIPINPATNEVELGTIKEQTRLSLNNIKAIVDEAGTTMENLVKLTVFMTDLSNFSAVNEVFQEFFSESAPARSAVEVSALPKGVDIEIEGIAIVL